MNIAENAKPTPSVAIAIPTYLREEALVITLGHVAAQSGADVELLVVDQTPAHEPATESTLRHLCQTGNARWIRTPKPSLTGARNIALASTGADVVLFLDDDVIVSPSLVAAHLVHYADPAVAAVSGNVIQATPRAGRLPFEVARVSGVPSLSCEHPMSWAHLVGANFSVRRQAAIDVGGFDEAFAGSSNYEENDFAARLLRSGGRIVADPQAAVVHLRWPAGGCRGDAAPQEWMRSYNYLLYLCRHVRNSHEMRRIAGEAYRVGPGRDSLKGRPRAQAHALAAFAYAAARALTRWSKPPISPWSHR